MKPFSLDPRLAADCITLGEMPLSLLLLFDNSIFPWLILVPRRDAVELFQLARDEQLALLEEINLLSRFVKDQFGSEKLNVAAIGNIVRQLHIHVVGRSSADPIWPGVVWGYPERTPYSSSDIVSVVAGLENRLPEGMFRKR